MVSFYIYLLYNIILLQMIILLIQISNTLNKKIKSNLLSNVEEEPNIYTSKSKLIA